MTHISPRTAIVTAYLGPTNTLGARISARCKGEKVLSVPYDHALSLEENHARAARKLTSKLNWPEDLLGAYLGDRKYVFVCDISF